MLQPIAALARTVACALAASAALLGVTSTASAQDLLRPGTSVSGTISGTTEQFDGWRGDCYVLETTPASRWIISMPSSFDSMLRLGVGQNCAEATWIRQDDDGLGNLDARMVFNAGGGSYVVMATSFGGNATGTYSLLVTQEPGEHRRGLMRAGVAIVRAPEIVGSASTVAAATPSTLAPGQTLQDCPECPSMVVVGAGSFMMGSPASEENRNGSEGPRHLVTLSRPFAIGRYEVTFDEYDACVAANGCRRLADESWGRGRRPVTNVTFTDAQRYVAWLSEKTGQKYFVPTEAEWEYAARAGTDTPWNTGSAVITDDANILDQFAKTVVVGGYAPNAFGLYDTIGNVAEWTQDCMDTGYVGAPSDGSAATSGNCDTQAIVRGGSFRTDIVGTRSASRIPTGRRQTTNGIGFRVTRAL